MNLQDRERQIDTAARKSISRAWLALVFIALFWGCLIGWSLRTIVVK